jgi:MFS family permease
MATQESQVPLNVAKPVGVSKNYLNVLIIISMAGIALSGFDSIARSVALPLIRNDLHMSITFSSEVFSLSAFVSIASHLILGQLSDRWGRKNTFLAALLITALTSGLTAFITSAWQFALTGAIAGVAVAVPSTAQVLAGEEMPADKRGIMTGAIAGSFSIGGVIVSLVGAVILATGNWRPLFIIAFAPILIAIIAAIMLREPPRAVEVKQFKKGLESASELTYRVDTEKAKLLEWKQIFASDLRRQTIVLIIAALMISVAVGFILTLGVTYVGSYNGLSITQAALSLTIISGFGIIGAIVMGRLGDYVSSRFLILICTVLSGLALASFAIKGGVGLIFPAAAVFGFFGQGMVGCWFKYVTESFPTRARGTGILMIQAMYGMGVVYGPLIFGVLMGAGDYPATVLLAAFIPIVGALVLYAGLHIAPHKELEEIQY